MALESATYVGNLVSTNPVGTDGKSQGDDHIRLIKAALQATFPGLTFAVTFSTFSATLLDDADAATMRATLGVLGLTTDNKIVSVDAGAGAGPKLTLFRNSASAADNDLIGVLEFSGNNDNASPAEKVYATIGGKVIDSGDTTEDGAIYFKTTIAGTDALRFWLGHGLYAEGVTGGDKGDGSANFKSLFLNGTQVVPSAFRSTGTMPATATVTDRVLRLTASGTVNLPAAATAGAGFPLVLINGAASGDVTIDPDGAETLDGLATRVLRPGDRVEIMPDGSNWFTLRGKYSFESADLTPALSTPYTQAHGLGEKPNWWQAVYRCISADGGWAVGDEMDFTADRPTYGNSLAVNATNIYATLNQTYESFFGNLTTGDGFNIDNAKWKLVLRCARIYG
jgi:hypothetical protein